MEYVTRSELQDLLTKNEENRHNLKALWHNVNLALHDLKPRVERAYISINGIEYNLLENPPVLTGFSSIFYISISFDSGWGTWMEHYFSQALNRDQSRQFVRQIYNRFREDLNRSDRNHMLEAIMDSVGFKCKPNSTPIEELLVVLDQELKGHLRNHDVSIEKAVSRKSHGRYAYFQLNGERVASLEKVYYLHSKEPHWTLSAVRTSIDKLLKKIYK